MTTLQLCVDYLLSAGGSYVSDGNELRLFYVNQKDSDFVLSYRDYTGSTLGPLKKVVDGVKQNSSASYLRNESNPSLIVCVSASSTLRVLEFDEDEDEWADSKSFPSSTIHPSGQLAAISDAKENSFIFFQDPNGRLTLTQGSSSSLQPLPANAISSTPLSAALVDNNVILFYIALDNLVHYLTLKGGKWLDTTLAPETFKVVPKRFVAYATDDGDINVLAISENSALVLINSNGKKTVLGRVEPNGSFVPGNTEESGITIQIGCQNNCVCM